MHQNHLKTIIGFVQSTLKLLYQFRFSLWNIETKPGRHNGPFLLCSSTKHSGTWSLYQANDLVEQFRSTRSLRVAPPAYWPKPLTSECRRASLPFCFFPPHPPHVQPGQSPKAAHGKGTMLSNHDRNRISIPTIDCIYV